ncbi:MAG TPA: ADYC domain-containing protein [Kofleriaceae bacterium]
MFRLALALALGGAACTVDRSEPSTATETSALIDPYIGQQGRLLLGFRDPDVRTFTFPSSVVGLHVDTDGQLLASGYAGTQFIGMPMIGTDGTTNTFMKISNVVNSTAPNEAWLYALEQWNPATGQWIPACAEPLQLIPPTTPPAGPPLAIAMPGTWSRDGFYTYDLNKVSFACRTGVVAKCNLWGYAPQLHWPTVTENGLATPGRGPDMLQACTRMARADFCALGVPNTLDGTPIHLDDIYAQPPPDPAYAFEAAWPGLAVMASPMIVRPPPPRRLPAICLSKLRWSTLPLGGGCTALPDPRVDSKGVFCDDLPQTTLELKGALTYSASSFIDAGLYTYTEASTGTRLTTSNLLPQAVGQLPQWLITPPPGIPFPIAGAPLPQFEATIFSTRLPPDLPTANLQKLASYQCGNDLITEAIGPNAPKCTFIANEGYVYVPGTAGRAPLRRWWNPSTKRSYTTAASPSTMIPGGWWLTDVVGAVIRATINVNVRWSAIQGATYSLDVQLRTGEWIAPCLDGTQIGGSSSVAYTGVCTSAAMRKVDHADIQAFRVTATTSVGSTTATRPYDGVDSDWYITIPGGQASAVALSWNDVGGGAHYRFEIMRNGLWDKCIDADALGPSTSYVHTGFCPALGTSIKLALTQGLRICALLPGQEICAEVPYGGETRAIFDLPAIE